MPTTKDDAVCLRLGREIVRMIGELRKVTGGETGYSRRLLTFPGGEVHLLLANDSKLADLMETAADAKYAVETVTPPSQLN